VRGEPKSRLLVLRVRLPEGSWVNRGGDSIDDLLRILDLETVDGRKGEEIRRLDAPSGGGDSDRYQIGDRNEVGGDFLFN
jgi:hypothetical protein